MKLLENISLAPFTTFKIGGPARFFCSAQNEDDVAEAVKFAQSKKLPIFVLGGGSNILICDEGFAGLVLKIDIKGIMEEGTGGRGQGAEKSSDPGFQVVDTDSVTISIAAGENWDDFVKYTVEQGLYGVENLSAIPGNVGATPVQNIGAYGAEISKVIEMVRAFDTEKLEFVELSNSDCHFSYRDSIFKHEKGRYIITRIDLKLSKNGKVNIEYKDVKEYFAKKNNQDPTLAEVRQAVIEIRARKLPDLTKWGTAGSFFKNPIVSAEKFNELKKQYPDLPGFPELDGRVKVSLGWILDNVCEAKGLTMGNVGTYDKQALVVVAKPGATSSDVTTLKRELMDRVREKTGLEIEMEVEWVC